MPKKQVDLTGELRRRFIPHDLAKEGAWSVGDEIVVNCVEIKAEVSGFWLWTVAKVEKGGTEDGDI